MPAGGEELYKVSKQFLEQLHGGERLVKQELFAHFNLSHDAAVHQPRRRRVAAGRPRAGKRHRRPTSSTAWPRWRRTWKACCCATPHLSARLRAHCTWVGTGRRKPRSNHSSLARAPKWSRRKAAPPSQVDADTDEHALSLRNRKPTALMPADPKLVPKTLS